MTREEFEALVTDALASLPSEIVERMDNVAVTVAYWPSRAQLVPSLNLVHPKGGSDVHLVASLGQGTHDTEGPGRAPSANG